MSRALYFFQGTHAVAAVTEHDRLCEYMIEQDSNTTERIVLGKVVRIVPALNAAFVNIGEERDGFLPLGESNVSGQKSLSPGQNVLVQVKKNAKANKGAFLTRDIAICGQYVILLPLNLAIHISSKIQTDDDRKRLSALGKNLTDGSFGLLFRTSSLNASDDQILSDLEILQAQWAEIQHYMERASAPFVGYQPRSIFQKVLDDYFPRGVEQIYVSPAFNACSLPESIPVMVVQQMHSQFEKDLCAAQSRYIWMKNGGALYIDEGEALTMIDVNTAKMTKGKKLDTLSVQMNLESIPEIVRQIRLRNLSGIILIDFIDMETDDQRKIVADAVKKALEDDRVKTVVYGFTNLGLLEMTRKRTANSLRESIMTVCSHCHGNGRIPTAQEVFYDSAHSDGDHTRRDGAAESVYPSGS